MPHGTGVKGKRIKEDFYSLKEEVHEPTQEEILLQEQLDGLDAQLDGLKRNVGKLRLENDWLQQEAHRVNVESKEYMSYMEKKTSKRQTTIVTLSDQNQRDIHNIMEQKNIMLKEYEEKKAALRNVFLEKESQLSKTKLELADLYEYKNLQNEQLTKIKDLEDEVLRLKAEHNDVIQELKSKFLREKNDYKKDAKVKIDAMAKEANREALECLNDHTTRIKTENKQLKAELLKLINKTRALHTRKDELAEEKKIILREQDYAHDLKRLRNTRFGKAKPRERMSDEGSRSSSTAAEKL